MWEIPALAVIMELRSRAVLRGSRQVRVAGALRPRHDAGVGKDRAPAPPRRPEHRRLRHAPPPRLPLAGLVRAGDDRGTGPRVSRHLELPDRHARREVEAIGTNAHELPMVYAALAQDPDTALADAPYRVLADWQEDYDGNLQHHPAGHLRQPGVSSLSRAGLGGATGPASASTAATQSRPAKQAIAWWQSARTGPVGASSRSSPMGSTSTTIVRLHSSPFRRARSGNSYGWGTLLTNDFRGLAPDGRSRSVLDRLQGHQRQRAAGRETIRQPEQSGRPQDRDRALQEGVRPYRRQDGAGSGVGGSHTQQLPPVRALGP